MRGETKQPRHSTDWEAEDLEASFQRFGNHRSAKLQNKIKILREQKEQKEQQRRQALKALKKIKRQQGRGSSDDDDDGEGEGSVWVVDRTTCETDEQKCVLWHVVSFFFGVGTVYGAVELALRGKVQQLSSGSLIPILLGVLGGMLFLHATRMLFRDYQLGLFPCQEVLNKQSTYDRRNERLGSDLETSISLAHARANQLNKAAMELPSIEELQLELELQQQKGQKQKARERISIREAKETKTKEEEEKNKLSSRSSEGSYYSSDISSSEDDRAEERSRGKELQMQRRDLHEVVAEADDPENIVDKKATPVQCGWVNEGEEEEEEEVEEVKEEEEVEEVEEVEEESKHKKKIKKRHSFAMDDTSSSSDGNSEDDEMLTKNNQVQQVSTLDFRAFKSSVGSNMHSPTRKKKKKKIKKKKKKKERKPGQAPGMIPMPPIKDDW